MSLPEKHEAVTADTFLRGLWPVSYTHLTLPTMQ